MTVQITQAAESLQQLGDNVSPHQLISFLLAGTLERVAQAKNCIEQDNQEEKEILIGKIVAIINGLRNSLNFNEGGDIAVNLEDLYAYMVEKISDAQDDRDEIAVLDEIASLIGQVKSGWDGIEDQSAAEVA